jgi:hypothetical protein
MTDMTDMEGLYIEEKLLNSVTTLLSGRVNELLGERDYPVPPIEMGKPGVTGLSGGVYAVTPVVRLATCERSEKERIVLLDAYSLTITFTVPEHPAGERNGYAYAWAVDRALGEDPALGGAVDRAGMTGKKYSPPKHPGTGGDWGVTLILRVVVEGVGYAG